MWISNRPPTPHPQQTPVWCWAASIETIFSYYGHDVQQSTIVARYYGAAVPVTGNPLTMSAAFNTTWADTAGRPFSVSAPVTDLYNHTANEVNNQMIVDAIAEEKPVFYADRTHAMVVVQLDYAETPGGPAISSAWVIDPYPGPNYGYRRAQLSELQAFFVAIPSVDRTDSQPGSSGSVSNTASPSHAGSSLAYALIRGSGDHELAGGVVAEDEAEKYLDYDVNFQFDTNPNHPYCNYVITVTNKGPKTQKVKVTTYINLRDRSTKQVTTRHWSTKEKVFELKPGKITTIKDKIKWGASTAVYPSFDYEVTGMFK